MAVVQLNMILKMEKKNIFQQKMFRNSLRYNASTMVNILKKLFLALISE